MQFDLLRNHPMNFGNYKLGWGKETDYRDDDLLNSMCDYFENRLKTETISYENSQWVDNIARQKDIITLFEKGDLDKLHLLLKNMFSSQLTHGTAQGEEQTYQFKRNQNLSTEVVHCCYDRLVSLMEMFEIIPIFNPEEYSFLKKFDNFFRVPPEVYLTHLMDKFKVDLSSPRYSGDLIGLETKFGVYNERDIIAIGIALLIKQKFPEKDISICEIGGGVGHLAYYLNKLGYKNISIVDLPTISLSQMYFLSINIGKDIIKLLSPFQFTGNYDIVLNVDSMTEMSIESARDYCDQMKNKTNYFLSVNHESNPFTVSQICKMKKISRNQFWLRKGYIIEEFIK